MIAFAAAAQELHLDDATLRVWIAQGWVRPRRERGEAVFEPVDMARLLLIQDLREHMGVGDEAMPVVLSLLDQLHLARAQMRHLAEAIEATPDASASEVVRRVLGL